jgi:hypothetical protein
MMTYFPHTEQHQLDCDCDACFDVDTNKSIARELERCVESLVNYSSNNLGDEHSKQIHIIAGKILLLRRYFPKMELPHKHARLIADFEANLD